MEKSPDAFRTISEAASELSLPQHVLRFWQTRFAQIKPLKRGGGRRYYRPADVLLLKGIRYLLYDQGFTIKGVQRILREQGPRYVIAVGEAGSLEVAQSGPGGPGGSDAPTGPQPGEIGPPQAAVTAVTDQVGQKISAQGRQKLAEIMRELLECKRELDSARDG